MMLRDVVVGVGQGNSTSVPTAWTREIQGIQQLVRIARNFCTGISHANFAIRSIPVRRTRIKLHDSEMGAAFSRVNDGRTRPRRSGDARKGIRARAGGTSDTWRWLRDRAACAAAPA